MRYGFVTFTTASSAYDAVERASRDPRLADYNVAFGGRRQFCDSSYADLGRSQISLLIYNCSLSYNCLFPNFIIIIVINLYLFLQCIL